jgi:hypothetical protein
MKEKEPMKMCTISRKRVLRKSQMTMMSQLSKKPHQTGENTYGLISPAPFAAIPAIKGRITNQTGLISNFISEEMTYI